MPNFAGANLLKNFNILIVLFQIQRGSVEWQQQQNPTHYYRPCAESIQKATYCMSRICMSPASIFLLLLLVSPLHSDLSWCHGLEQLAECCSVACSQKFVVPIGVYIARSWLLIGLETLRSLGHGGASVFIRKTGQDPNFHPSLFCTAHPVWGLTGSCRLL